MITVNNTKNQINIDLGVNQVELDNINAEIEASSDMLGSLTGEIFVYGKKFEIKVNSDLE
ncbi:hypothetical protein ACFLY2_02395 [Patescibacteria group bacterium]